MTHLKKATKIELFKIKPMHMRIFHFTWFAFFVCFLAWFGIAPLMPYVREDLDLTKEQIGNTIIASVFVTVFARILIGWIIDKIGPRITYSLLLILGSIPVMLIGLSNSYETFLLFRLAIGIIGASFVITQYHTSLVFSSNVVGTANATTAGWGNLGGGVTQFTLPLIMLVFLSFGYSESQSWRYSMVVPGIILFITGILYFLFTKDTLNGNFNELRKQDPHFMEHNSKTSKHFFEVIKDFRVWALFIIYAACFGIELTINNIAAIYYVDNFQLSPTLAGFIASLFGLMNIFARTLGGIYGDKMGIKYGLKGRVIFLGIIILLEGIALIIFSQMKLLPLAIATMIIFSLFVQMAEGATFSVVPFINRKAIGSVSGIVGAGGNTGAVLAGFLFRGSLTYQNALLILGCIVAFSSLMAFLVKFNEVDEELHEKEIQFALKPALEVQ
ncbi:MAG: MFS transporter [Leptospiraceae bacterium]|nr:MAG: MFS transporter [Leptospiraceae bacterium]